MKKTTILAAVLTVFFASQAMAAPQYLSLTTAEPEFRPDMYLSSTSDEMRKAYRRWKRETDANQIEKEYRKWKKNRSDRNSSREKYRSERRKKQEEDNKKSYERWKKRNPKSKKTYKDWKKERDSIWESKDFEKWRKKHRRDWENWRDDTNRDGIFENTQGGDGDGGGSGGAE